nr:leucine-rich repeat receptor-like protein kinase TDR [Ipomoea batatas]
MPVMTSAGENDLTSSWRIASCHLDLGLSYSSCTSWPFRMDAIGVGLGNSMMSLGVIGIGLTEWMPLGWGLGNSMMSLGVMHSFSALTSTCAPEDEVHNDRPKTQSCYARFSLVFSIDAAATANLPLQLISLLSLKSSLKDPFNTFHDWDPAPTLSSPGFRPLWCRWSGVKCADDNKSGRVTGLDLSGRNLSGNIPEDIRYLLHLHHLNLSGNLFDGPLPPVIFEFSFLRTLDFSNNSFNSTFPPRISRLKSLTLLNGFSNNFVGALPREIARLRNLEYLNLGGATSPAKFRPVMEVSRS